jgi:hypothetical protein
MSRHRDRGPVDFVDLAGLGFVLILVGSLIILRPDLPSLIRDFFTDFELQQVWGGNVYLPVPMSNHQALYGIAFDFCLYMLAFQVLGLLFRFVLNELVRKKASSVSGVVFWGGFAWILNLLSAELIGWPAFLGWLIVVAGTSIVVQSILTILLYSLRTP